jgi:hypothetical protein
MFDLHFIIFIISALLIFAWLMLAGFNSLLWPYFAAGVVVLLILVRAFLQRIK